jgi:hypothetical protein
MGNLRFVRMANTDNRLLNRIRGIFPDSQPSARWTKHRDAAGLP